jgi:malonyl-CoA O-methyltransferase
VENKTQTAKCFSKAAVNYCDYAIVQKQAAQQLFALFPNDYKKKSNILDLGSGPLLHEHLLKQYANDVYHVDLSHTMLTAATGKKHHHKICADMDALPFKYNSFDTVFSNFAMQWTNSYKKLFDDLFSICRSGSHVYFSTVLDGSLCEIEDAWKSIDSGSHINKFITFKLLNTLILNSGFRCAVQRKISIKDDFESPIEAIKSVKKIGANHLMTKHQQKKNMSKHDYKTLINAYPLKDNKAQVTYEVAIMELIKP